MLPIKTYIIVDTQTGEQWSNGAKAFWTKSSYAKSALLNKVPTYPSSGEFFLYFDNYLTQEYLDIVKENRYPPSLMFKDQTRFICIECDVVKVKEV